MTNKELLEWIAKKQLVIDAVMNEYDFDDYDDGFSGGMEMLLADLLHLIPMEDRIAPDGRSVALCPEEVAGILKLPPSKGKKRK